MKILRKIKKLLPKSLFGRFLLIILIPNIIVQLVAVYMFYERHWSGVSRHMASSLIGEIIYVVRGSEKKSGQELEGFLYEINNSLFFKVYFKENEKISSTKTVPVNFPFLERNLKQKIPFKHIVYYSDEKASVNVDIEIPQGLLNIKASKKRLANQSTYIFIIWMTSTAALLVLISIFFMRNQVRSIINLAEVAEKFGKGQDFPEFKPSGAAEVRKAGLSFIQMRERIQKQIEQRTEMLAGVSHDLKTPLTRIKLQLAMMDPSKEIKSLQEDAVEMEKMVQEYLDFAKGKERVVDATVNIADLLRSVIAGYRDKHKKIELKTQKGILLHVNSNAFRRVLNNLIDNALRYGENIKITVSKSEKNMILVIDDDGPGIPQKKRELVFKPFYRIDNSRNLQTGGTGLGLSIAKDIVLGYGGKIDLDDSPQGGLRVTIKIPL